MGNPEQNEQGDVRAVREQKESKTRLGKAWQRNVGQGNKLERIRGSHSLANHSPANFGLSSSCIPSISWLINVRIFPGNGPAGYALRSSGCSGSGSVKVSQSDLIRAPQSVTLPRIDHK